MEKKSREKESEKSVELAPFWRHGWPELDKAFDNFRRDFERTFATFPLGLPTLPSISTMSCDIVDEGDKFLVNIDLPGVKKDEIKLNVTDNSIEISAEHKEQQEEKKKNYVRKERKELSYHRILPLPEKVSSSKASAKLNNGILTIEIPKTTPTPKPKSATIPVQ
ncbi:MAG TPA: Hsp20/alpha crystallin family protein [Nitrosopumilaceae archaeon]|nr:Hsp20/alpha crystallin family protein [Nitrosopumilaceae archaeon]